MKKFIKVFADLDAMMFVWKVMVVFFLTIATVAALMSKYLVVGHALVGALISLFGFVFNYTFNYFKNRK